MNWYRIYPLDQSGRVMLPLVIESGRDDAALEEAPFHVPAGLTAEVWQGSRRIGIVQGQSQA